MATKKMQNNLLIKTADQLKVQTIALADGAVETTDFLVESSLTYGKKWQGVFSKVLKFGTNVFGDQQDLMLTTLEGLKDQIQHGNKRMKKLLELKPTTNVKNVTPVKVVKEVAVRPGGS